MTRIPAIIFEVATSGPSFKQQLTTNGSADRYPLMSPDMKTIYFMSNRGGHWGI